MASTDALTFDAKALNLPALTILRITQLSNSDNVSWRGLLAGRAVIDCLAFATYLFRMWPSASGRTARNLEIGRRFDYREYLEEVIGFNEEWLLSSSPN